MHYLPQNIPYAEWPFRPTQPTEPPAQAEHYFTGWRTHAPPPALFSNAFASSSSWMAPLPAPPAPAWSASPPDFLLPLHYGPLYPVPAPYPVARSDTSSTASRASDISGSGSGSPAPAVAEVVCNAPLVAPIPLPYHSPTFLLYDLPDEDEDLSHPPYTSRPHKRKRDLEPAAPPPPAKRRSIAVEQPTRWDAPRHRTAAHPHRGPARRGSLAR